MQVYESHQFSRVYIMAHIGVYLDFTVLCAFFPSEKKKFVCIFGFRIKMPETYVVHLGNSKDLMEVAEDSVAKRVLREHVRESLGVRDDDLLFAIINSMFSLLMK